MKKLLTLFCFSLSLTVQAQLADELICEYLGYTVSCDEEEIKSIAKDFELSNLQAVTEFYAYRECNPVWYSEGKNKHLGAEVINVIYKANEDGLDREDYHYTPLQQKLSDLVGNVLTVYSPTPTEIARFDILMTDAYLSMAEDMRYGKLDVSQNNFSWEINNDKLDFSKTLSESIDRDEVTTFMNALIPAHPLYKKLKRAYSHYTTLAAIHADRKPLAVSAKPVLGDSSKAVAELRERLNIFYPMVEYTNYLEVDSTRETLKVYTNLVDSTYKLVDTLIVQADSLYLPAYFDTTLQEYVREFQWQYGLKPDGEFGSQTMEALNVPMSERLKQIEINLDRWRWCNRRWGEQHIMANIASYNVQVYEQDSLAHEQITVVGSKWHRTPVFQDMMLFVEFNPYWNVPYSISSREIITKLRKDPSYLVRNNMLLLSGGKKVNPASVDWSQIFSNNFPYRIQQQPGPKNALGRVKFLFPNEYSIYMHDTPSQKPFQETIRAYSHGCVRLSEPIRFAEYILDGTKYDAQKIKKTLDRKKNKRIVLEEPIPVYILYFTTWVDQENNLRFQPDVYKRDRDLLERW